jgi:protease YdgD
VKYKFVFILIFSLILSGKLVANQSSVIGADNRSIVTEPHLEKPFSMIGKLRYKKSSKHNPTHCTASLVGPNLILTNAHCVFWVSDTRPQKIFEHMNFVFIPADTPNKANLEITATWLYTGTKDPIRFVSADYTLLRLSQHIGNELGYFDISNDHFNQLKGRTISTAGYSGDIKGGKYMTTHQNCKITNVHADNANQNAAFLKHNCDTTAGASGSPLYVKNGEQYTIVGLHSRGASGIINDNDFKQHNSAVYTQFFYNEYKQHLKDQAPTFYEKEIHTLIDQCNSLSESTKIEELAADMIQVEKLLISDQPGVINFCNKSDTDKYVSIRYQEATSNNSDEIKVDTLYWKIKSGKKVPSLKCITMSTSHLKRSELHYLIKTESEIVPSDTVFPNQLTIINGIPQTIYIGD